MRSLIYGSGFRALPVLATIVATGLIGVMPMPSRQPVVKPGPAQVQVEFTALDVNVLSPAAFADWDRPAR